MDRRDFLAVVVGGTVGLAGCSGDGDDGAGEGTDGAGTTAATTSGVTATPTTAATGTATEATTRPATDAPTASPTETATATPTAAPTETPTATPTETPTATPTQTATATPTRTPTSGGDAAATVTVGANGSLVFDPDSVTVAVGETVRWEWASSGHNVVPTGKPYDSTWSGTPGAPDDTYDEGYVYEYTFEVAGTYDYECDPHASFGMAGTVVVE